MIFTLRKESEMSAIEQAIRALGLAASFADQVAEVSGDEDAINVHRRCLEAISALKEASRQQQTEAEEAVCVTP
jgi:hypothetical protein